MVGREDYREGEAGLLKTIGGRRWEERMMEERKIESGMNERHRMRGWY